MTPATPVRSLITTGTLQVLCHCKYTLFSSVASAALQQHRQPSAKASTEVPSPIPPVSLHTRALAAFCVGCFAVIHQVQTRLSVMSCTKLVFLATLLVCTTMAAAQPWTAPAFCKGLDCPKYTVVKQLGDGIELRRYEPASWVSTSGTGMDKDSAMRGSFMKLFDYISGSNSDKKKIPMTGPVLTKIEPGQGPNCESTFTMNFYNPYSYQGTNAASVPKPTGSGVFITNTPAMEVYVIQYGGFSSAAMERMKATELIKKLEASKEPFSAGVWYTAGYDSPYTLTNRHNEVWIPRSASGSGAAAGSGASPAGSNAAAGSGGGTAKTTTESGKKAQDEKKP